MKEIVDTTVRLVRVGKRAYARKWTFFGLFVVALLGSVAILAELDLLPEAPAEQELVSAPRAATAPEVPIAVAELPVQIETAKIKLAAPILNPTTTDIGALDRELLKGAVRYPTSAKLGETGNVVLFGHSSYLPVVRNEAYKTFNDIQKLTEGDVITVYSSDTAYTYRVRSVSKENADENTPIPLSVDGRVLTLVTCDSFGKKSDRFIVIADFVESHPTGT